MHSVPMFQFSCARQNIKRFGGIMKHVQMLQLVACFLLLNFAQMADEMMLIMSLVLRHQFPRHQATLFMVEHSRRRRRRARRHSPYLWKLSRPNRSWFEIHYNDRTIPEAFFRRQLRIDRCTFDVLLNVLRPAATHENTKLRDCIAPEKVLALGLYRLAHENSYESIRPNFNVGRSSVLGAVQEVVEDLLRPHLRLHF